MTERLIAKTFRLSSKHTSQQIQELELEHSTVQRGI